ncbi:hypothetical protein [Enhygromyxa salina]|nr:hypothetical protein [Enhygromyxa salina]
MDPEPQFTVNPERMTTSEAEEAAQTLIRDSFDRLRKAIRRRPLAAVSGAFVAGFVLGNGIPRFIAQTAVSMGLRALIERTLAGGSSSDAAAFSK